MSKEAMMIGLLDEARDEMRSLIGMMEPYYSQGNADSDARALIERISAVLPPPYVPPAPKPIKCKHCTGGKANRVFRNSNDLKKHIRSIHESLAALQGEQP